MGKMTMPAAPPLPALSAKVEDTAPMGPPTFDQFMVRTLAQEAALVRREGRLDVLGRRTAVPRPSASYGRDSSGDAFLMGGLFGLGVSALD